MKILPTLEGGLRVDAEDEGDWAVLAGIAHDAVSCDESLANRLGKLITEEEIAPDWNEFILPELDVSFQSDVVHVAQSIHAARMEAAGGPGHFWITRDEGFQWYSTLNQARLAIEERFHFGPGGNIDPDELEDASRSAFLRSQFYCAVQSLLLERVLS